MTNLDSFRYQPQLLAEVILDEFVVFAITFISTPNYIKNPYLRAKLTEV
jgi:ubiquitin conjugation factor E4 B